MRVVDEIRAQHPVKNNICVTLDEGHAWCIATGKTAVNGRGITFAEVSLWESKGEGHLGRGRRPILRMVCEDRRPVAGGTFIGGAECKDFDTGEIFNFIPGGGGDL